MERLLSRYKQIFLINYRSEEALERTMRFHKQDLAVAVRVSELVGQYRPAPASLPEAIL